LYEVGDESCDVFWMCDLRDRHDPQVQMTATDFLLGFYDSEASDQRLHIAWGLGTFIPRNFADARYPV
jgi:hypothetical protein